MQNSIFNTDFSCVSQSIASITLHFSYLAEAHNSAVAKAPSQKSKIPPNQQTQTKLGDMINNNVKSFSVLVN